VSRHVQVQLRPLCCGVDTSGSSTGLSSVDTSICSSGPCCVDTSTEAAEVTVAQTRPCAAPSPVLWGRQIQEYHRPLHYQVDTSKCSTGLCSIDKFRSSSGFCCPDKSRCSSAICGVDRSRCCRSLCSVDTSRCNSGPCAISGRSALRCN
jgi:hypothetical protein